jgi:acetylornithine deacetylase/succinyl-diaminopimelate desuccinylase-like protein
MGKGAITNDASAKVVLSGEVGSQLPPLDGKPVPIEIVGPTATPEQLLLAKEHRASKTGAGGAPFVAHKSQVEGAPLLDPVPDLSGLGPVAEQVAHAIRDLVRVSSQGGADEPGAICQALLAMLEQAGLAGKLLLDPTGRPAAVVAEIGGKKPGPTYVLDAVVDTAPIGDPATWSAPPLSGQVKDGRMYGRGTADSKAAAAIFIQLGKELASKADSLAGKVVLFFDAAEHTGEFQGVKAFLAAYPKVDGVMIGYPGDQALNVGSRGFCRSRVHFSLQEPGDPAAVIAALRGPASLPLPGDTSPDFSLPPKLTLTAVSSSAGAPIALGDPKARELVVRVSGQAAHSGSSKIGGVNAALKAARLLEVLEQVGKSRFGDGFSLTVGAVGGGRDFSQVPDLMELKIAVAGANASAKVIAQLVERAMGMVDKEMAAPKPSTLVSHRALGGSFEPLGSLTTNVDVRTTPVFGDDAARKHLETSVKRATGGSLGASIEELESWAAFVLPKDSPLRTAMEEGVKAAEGKPLPSVVSGPSNVGNLLATHGIPATTGYGVSFEGMHAANESIELGSITKVLEAYRQTLQRLFGG